MIRKTTAPLLASLALLALAGTPAEAQQRQLAIELNKVDATEQGCRPVFVFDNATGHQLNRLQIDLVLFDQKGVYAKQALLDMAPLYPSKKVVASFLLNETPCDQIGSILVNGLPVCEPKGGVKLDCLQLLAVSSKTSIPLEK